MMGLNNHKGGALLVLLLLLQSLSAFTQKHDYNWMFETRWSDTLVLLRFDQKPDVQKILSEMQISISNATMSDKIGNFVFNTNGCYIQGPDFELMENGDNINPGERHRANCSGGYRAGHQTILSLPVPEVDTLFQLFHIRYDILTEPILLFRDELLSSMIANDKSRGRYLVTVKNKVHYNDQNIYAGVLTAVKHENTQDWWILNPMDSGRLYIRFLLKKDTIEGPFFQQIGDSASVDCQAGGGAQFSPDGEKYIKWCSDDGTFLFDFDRETGELSNFQRINNAVDSILFGGIAVSPNSRFLYISTIVNLFQYDLWADDILGSEVLIDTYDGFLSPFPCNFWAMQLGPDCKIYMASTSSCDHMGVIHRPNEKGLACDFEQHGLRISPGYAQHMPHFPNYRLGTAPVCDSTLSVSVVTIPFKEKPKELVLTPNPTSDVFEVHTDLDFNMIRVIDVQGHVVATGQDATINISDQPSGVYVVQLIHEDRVMGCGRVVKAK